MAGVPITPEIHEKVVSASKTGLTFTEAVMASGYNSRVARSWENRGKVAIARLMEGEDRSSLSMTDRNAADLVDAVEVARSQAKVFLLGLIIQDARTDTNSAKWLLEAQFDVRGKKARSGDQGGRPVGSVSAPDRKVLQTEPPRFRLSRGE